MKDIGILKPARNDIQLSVDKINRYIIRSYEIEENENSFEGSIQKFTNKHQLRDIIYLKKISTTN